MSETSVKSTGQGAAQGGVGDDEAPARRGRKKLVVLAVLLVALVAAAAWFLLPRGDATPEAAPEPVAGEVAPLEPISINLADGHYLRLGLALQLIEGAAEGTPDGSKALDLAISTFTGRDVAVLADPVQREAIKTELELAISEAYHEEVMTIYFTEFVTQ